MIAFFKGAGYFFKGFAWLGRPRVRSFVIVPLLVNALLFGAALWWGAGEFGQLIDQLLARLPAWLDWLRWLLWPLFAIAALLLVFYTFTLLANLIAAPFNGLLAERVEDLAGPSRVRPAGRPLWQELPVSVVGELRKLVYFILWAIPLLVLFLIPAVNALAPVLWAAFGAWMLALQYVDYPMGNHLIPFREQRRLLGQRPLLALGFGAAALLITLVPVLNFLVVPVAVIGATLLWVEEFPQARRPAFPPTPGAAASPYS